MHSSNGVLAIHLVSLSVEHSLVAQIYQSRFEFSECNQLIVFFQSTSINCSSNVARQRDVLGTYVKPDELGHIPVAQETAVLVAVTFILTVLRDRGAQHASTPNVFDIF